MPTPRWIFCLFYVKRMSNIPSASTDVAAFCTFGPVQLASYGSKLRPAGILAEEALLNESKKANDYLTWVCTQGRNPLSGLKGTFFMRGAGIGRREGGEEGRCCIDDTPRFSSLSVNNRADQTPLQKHQRVRELRMNWKLHVNRGWRWPCPGAVPGAVPGSPAGEFLNRSAADINERERWGRSAGQEFVKHPA